MELFRVRSALASTAPGWHMRCVRAASVNAWANERPAPPDAPLLGRAAGRVRAAVDGAIHVARAELRRRANGGHTAPVDEEAREGPPHHAWEPERVARELGVDPAVGLDAAEAEARRLAHGPNALSGIEPRSAATIVAGQVLTVPNAILGASAGASALLGDVLEGAAIAAVVATNVAIGYFTEQRAEDLLDAWGELRVGRARVLRVAARRRSRPRWWCRGTSSCSPPGMPSPRTRGSSRPRILTADESTLTGESEPAEKSVEPVPEDAALADCDAMVYAGTVIASRPGARRGHRDGGGHGARRRPSRAGRRGRARGSAGAAARRARQAPRRPVDARRGGGGRARPPRRPARRRRCPERRGARRGGHPRGHPHGGHHGAGAGEPQAAPPGDLSSASSPPPRRSAR